MGAYMEQIDNKNKCVASLFVSDRLLRFRQPFKFGLEGCNMGVLVCVDYLIILLGTYYFCSANQL